ncbi:MAG: zinc-binding dehydrogenase [Vicinamibacterales bacterium]
MGTILDSHIWTEGAGQGEGDYLSKGAVAAAEALTVRTISASRDGARFGQEVPASLFRLRPRSINNFSFWRLEVAIDPEQQHLVTDRHSLIVARHPYSTLWSSVAPFRRGVGDGGTPALPASVDTLEKTQRYVDLELDRDPWEQGERLVAGLSLPLNVLGVNSGQNRFGGSYLFGACEDPVSLERTLLEARGVERLVEWTDKGTFGPTASLAGRDETQAVRDILLTAALRLALAGPPGPGNGAPDDVIEYAQGIARELAACSEVDVHALQRSLALTRRSLRTFHVEAPDYLERKAAADAKADRLVYKCTGPGVLSPERVAMPARIADGEVLTELHSLTLCCTDVSNLNGVIGHGHKEARILGHENCNLVLDSKVQGIEPGDHIVPLGDDWLGLAEFEMFKAILPGDDPRGIDLVYDARGGYFDPDSAQHLKAVCVVKRWQSGISLIEPLTHVYTYFATAQDARIARTVVVLGGGACGLFFCRFVKLFGAASNVVLLDIMDERLQHAKEMGLADTVLNPATEEERCRDLINDTHGEYADVVFDALPGALPPDSPPTRRLAMQMLRPRGEYILYAAAESTAMPTIEMLAKGPRFHFAPYDSRVIDFTQRAQFMSRVLSMIESGQIRPERYISRQIHFHDTDQVQQLFREYGRTPEVKVEVLAH